MTKNQEYYKQELRKTNERMLKVFREAGYENKIER